MKTAAAEFQHALTTSRVVSRFAVLTPRKVAARFANSRGEVAMEFPTPEALEKYLKDHPGADKAKHTVKKPKGEGAAPGGGGAKRRAPGALAPKHEVDSMLNDLHTKGELKVKGMGDKPFTIKKVNRGGMSTYDVVADGKVQKKGLLMNEDALYNWIGHLDRD